MLMLRILFAWLLIAAVPMQGFAAASMLMCGMGEQHQHAAQDSEPHDHAAMHGHSGGDAHQGYTHAADPVVDASADGGYAPPDADHKCSICAACCNGVALVGLSYMASMPPAPQTELAEPFVRVHTLPTPVPDKPPRA